MEFLALLRTLGALAVVLGLLVGALWVVRRYDLRLPQKWLANLGDKDTTRRLELVERLSLDPRRQVVLIRRDYKEISLLIAPEGVIMLDSAPCSGITRNRDAGE
ncbi:flagellar protein FliO/FliZ [Novosphingobium sp. PhB165]|uniref:FliO/MopB family protein n=1 Tax=Novosphingobium sp. PhB165 TaxID=2485105 RepID=UPI001053FC80|nr:flagellar biosynthetic protein FliO [Novosphingobium sp. PhB165]TCM17728.1 flagellar protein FliO/FliZ [Novosphingobium sp. PhB165]